MIASLNIVNGFVKLQNILAVAMLTPTEEIQIALVKRLNDDSELFAYISEEGMNYPLDTIQVSYRRGKPEWDEVGRGRIIVDILLKEMEFIIMSSWNNTETAFYSNLYTIHCAEPASLERVYQTVIDLLEERLPCMKLL
jgi:hypothetical protein